MTQIEVRVCGIPAIAKLTHFHEQKPLGRWCDSREDCYGYIDMEFDICDRRGRRAEWLENKMTDADWAAVEKQILEARHD
jgi:hypothetical protein